MKTKQKPKQSTVRKTKTKTKQTTTGNMSNNINQLYKALGNKAFNTAHRKEMLSQYLQGCDEDLAEELFNKMLSGGLSDEEREKLATIDHMLNDIMRAPMRPATFVEFNKLPDSPNNYAVVMMDNGEMGHMLVHDNNVLKQLKLGDRVLLDGHAKILVCKNMHVPKHGHEARFERKVDERHVEITTHQDEKMVVLVNQLVADNIKTGKISPGDQLVVGSGGNVAIDAMPKSELTHYRFLDRGGIPDVVVDRDIGNPPRVISQVARHVREEMTRPELRRRFRLRPCITRLLCGVSGSGKTLAIQAIHHQLYDIMADVTDTSPEQLPNRVFRFKSSQILSMWLGESDKNADRLFDEVEKLAATPFTNNKGKTFKLPVMVVMEEAEGMSRTRGQSHDAIYDRILSTLLQRLDPNRAGLADQLIVFLCTTNEPHLVDPAFLRRIGGSIERFGRLDQMAFTEVLGKHIAGLPASNGNGKSQDKIWKEIITDLNQWLYNKDDKGVVELVMANSHSIVKHRKDFLTGALVDRSVQESSNAAWEESLVDSEIGITVEHLQTAISQQINSVIHQLTPENVSHYLDLPEGAVVRDIRNLAERR